MRPLDELRQLQRALRDLRRADAAAEESARFELTQSTRQFSRKAQEVLEDTMALSATLIRAGEVDEANLLIAEVEREVRDEEATLKKTMDEVEVERSERRRKIARLKLARLAAALVAGISLMAVSLAGIAVASMFTHHQSTEARTTSSTHSGSAGSSTTQPRQRVKIAGVVVTLTAHQLRTYQSINNGSAVQNSEVRQLLTAVLPQVPVAMVDRVQTAIVSAAGSVTVVVPPVVQQLTDAAQQIVAAPKHKGAETSDTKDSQQSSGTTDSSGQTQQQADQPPADDGSKSEGSDPSSGDGSSSGSSNGGSDNGGGLPYLPIPGGSPHL
jgi:uncharacterized membrane protein YgcG